MIWCAYCQQFQGEAPPYDRYLVSHGLCLPCSKNGLAFSMEQMDQAHRLRTLQEQLRNAGQEYDLPLARRLIMDAVGIGVRPVDILLGLITPLLYELGQEWEAGRVTVAEEHRFTKFCEQVLELISTWMHERPSNAFRSDKPTVLLLNAKGNLHSLGLQMVHLSLYSHGIRSEIVRGSLLPRQVLEKIEIIQPKVLGISVAVAEDVSWLRDAAEAVMTLAENRRPVLVVGGFAVHEGTVQAIKGIRLFTEFGSITSLVNQCLNV